MDTRSLKAVDVCLEPVDRVRRLPHEESTLHAWGKAQKKNQAHAPVTAGRNAETSTTPQLSERRRRFTEVYGVARRLQQSSPVSMFTASRQRGIYCRSGSGRHRYMRKLSVKDRPKKAQEVCTAALSRLVAALLYPP